MPEQWKSYQVESLDGGLDYSKNPKLVDDAGSSELLNIDLHDSSLRNTSGCIKLNNQVVRRPGIRFSPDPALSPLAIDVGKSVPLRSYGYLPYNRAIDFGGDGTYSGVIFSETCHFRRGKDFSLQVSFKIPEIEKFYEWETRGTGAPAEGAGGDYFERSFGYDEALDDTFIIIQKGGDGFVAPSWFIGVTNVGGTAPNGTSSAFALMTGYGQDYQISNYHLVFGWYDSPAWAHHRNQDMMYDLSDPSAAGSGRYCTQSLRALIVNYSVEPGEEYHLAVQLRLDSEDDLSGSSSWNDDGAFQVAVSKGLEKPRVFGYSRKNLLLSTERLTQTSAWTLTGLSAATADWDTGTPLPTSGPVDILEDDDVGVAEKTVQTVAYAGGRLSAGDYVLSGYLEKGTAATSSIKLSTGLIATTVDVDWSDFTFSQVNAGAGNHNVTLTQISGNKYRVTLNITFAGTSDLVCSLWPAGQTAGNTGTVKAWGFQLERATVATNYEPNEGVWTWRGPTDSAEYLTKYGIRYHGRDAIFLGLGMRFAPWQNLSFIPFGADAAPLERGGHCMVDRSSLLASELYPGSSYELKMWHDAGDAYIQTAIPGLTNGRSDGGGLHPTGERNTSWQGYDDGSGSFHASSLRGYRVVFLANTATHKGGIVTIDQYIEAGGEYRLTYLGTGTIPVISSGGAGGNEVVIQSFRWNQRSLILSEVRFYSGERDYYDPRTQFSLRSEALLDDVSDPDIDELLARYPLDDGEGGVLRETVLGVDGYLAPFQLGVSKRGGRGQNQLFLSGEGEALHLDLSTNPIFLREFRNAMRSGEGGVAIEITFTMPQAYYGINTDRYYGWAGANWTYAKYAPYLATWEVKNPNDSGLAITPDPILALTHAIRWETSAGEDAVKRPLGFLLEVPGGSDQQDWDTRVAFKPFTGDFSWNETGEWVGRRITLQFGIQSTGVEDTYNCYVAGAPARYLLQGGIADELGDHEFTLFSEVAIAKRDLERSVITIGGCWNAKDMAVGITEARSRIVVDEVRVFATAAPGAFAAVSGQSLGDQDGKLFGVRSLPPRELGISDLLQKPGAGVETANVVDGSTIVTAPGGTAFYQKEPEDTARSVKETYLLIAGDPYEVLELETVGRQVQEFYYVESVSDDGSQLNLSTPFSDVTRDNAYARVMRLVGYCSFPDDIRDKRLALGQGNTYVPGTTETDDIPISEEFFVNPCPVNTNWRFSVLSPIGDSLARFLPVWDRGLQSPRYGEILGLYPINERILVGSQGSLFEADDRWRNEGPTDTLAKSLLFRGKYLGGTNVVISQQDDRVVFPSTSGLIVQSAADLFSGGEDYAYIYDSWVKLRSIGQYQTVLAVFDIQRDPSETASARRMCLWIRIRDGFPQLCIGSSETYDGVNTPSEGLFVAEGALKLPIDQHVHVRWMLFGGSSGTYIKTPRLQVNGKNVDVSLNAIGNGLTGDNWITVANLALRGQTSRLVLGSVRDSYRDEVEDTAFTAGELKGPCLTPDRFHGWMHTLDGQLADVAIAITKDVTNPPANFNPYAIYYAASGVHPQEALFYSIPFRASLQEGIGHKVYGGPAYDQYGVIHSHPMISEFHEMGSQNDPFTFAPFGNRVFIANGGRVVVEEEGRADFAGVPKPSFSPSFEIVRTPLWVPNVAAVDPEDNPDTGIDENGNNDPIGAASVDDLEQLFHYSTRGNNYLLQAGHREMQWERQTELDPVAGPRSLLCIKTYLRMRSTSGRQLLWSSKSEGQSGHSLEIRDGRVGFVWWDATLKKEVSIFTSQPVIVPGYVHYLYFRKHFCPRHESDGNWVNSAFTNGKYRRVTVDMTSGTFSIGDLISAVSGAKGKVLRLDRTHQDAGTEKGSLCYYHVTGPEFTFGDHITSASGGADVASGSVPANIPRDSLVVRRFRKADSAFAWETDTTFDAKTDETPNNGGTMSSVRNCISFTGESWGEGFGPELNWFRAFNIEASGIVTAPGFLFSGAAGGIVNVDLVSATSVSLFHEDMKGMIWQWGDSAPAEFIHQIYRIKDVVSGTQIKVVLERDGSVPDFSTVSNEAGAVCTGISMQKSEDFDASLDADKSLYDIYWMGSPLQLVPQTGITPFDGETWSFGWACLDVGTNFDIFEAEQTENLETGTDAFPAEVYTDPVVSTPGPLTFDQANGEVFCAVDPAKASPADYVTTQPNADLQITPDATESSPNVTSLSWQSIDAIQLLSGKTQVWVTFLDPRTYEESNPSPSLEVVPSGEDKDNVSGDAYLLLKSIPTRPNLYRQIYMSLLDQYEGFLVATIPDDTSTTFAIKRTQEQIARGLPIRWDRDQPPRCSLVAVSQSQMFYGRHDGQPDGLLYSNFNEPQYVDFANSFVVDTGDDSEITGMVDQQGTLIVGKRNAMWRVQASAGIAVSQIITRGAGFLNQRSIVSLDNFLYWVHERGVMRFDGTGVPRYIGVKLEPYFEEIIDPSYLSSISASIYGQKSLFIFTARRIGDEYTHERFAFQYDHELSGVFDQLSKQALHKITRYHDPNIVVLAEVSRRNGGPRRLIGGSDDGFLYWMREASTTEAGLGADEDVWGERSLVCDAGASALLIPLSGSPVVDTDLEGPRGTRVRWLDGSLNQEAVVLFAESGVLHLDRAFETGNLPSDGDTVTLGALLFEWKSKHFDFKSPEQHKRPFWLDFTREPQVSGSLYVDVFKDMSGTAFVFPAVKTVDMTQSVSVPPIDIGECQFGRHYQFRLRTRADQVGVKFNILDATIRVELSEPR